MAASSNDNQGLKIAVACFVMLSVILAVTTYFGFSNYATSEKKLEQTNSDLSTTKNDYEKLRRLMIDIREKVGLPKAEDEDVPKQVTKNLEEMTKKVAGIAEEGRKTIDAYKGSGGNLGKLDEIRQSLDAIVAGLNAPASNSLLGSLDRLHEMLNNQTQLATALALEFHDTRRQLEAVDQVNAAQLDVEKKAVAGAKEDLNSEHGKHETERTSLMVKLDALQSDLNKLAGENTKLKNEITQREEDYRKAREDLLTQVRYFRGVVELKENVLDKKDGTISYVDYTQDRVGTDLRRSQGVREQMVFTVFDRDAKGIPSDKPKGTIELIKVGETGSIARIIETKKSTEPLRPGDQLYSPVFDANKPLQYALIGKMDVNRDGRDDREDLKRMIRAAGGIVSYDLPPPGVGVETGKLTALISWYVTDDRLAFHPSVVREAKQMAAEESTFLAKKTEAIRVARLDGIRPIPLERLLGQLGYSYGGSVPGKVEVIDRPNVNIIQNPKGRIGILPPKEGEEEKKDEEQPKS